MTLLRNLASRREYSLEEFQVGAVILDQPVRRLRFDLDPAPVIDVVHRLADFVKVNAALAEHEVSILGVEFADAALEHPDFLVNVVALVGRIAHVIVNLDRRRADALDNIQILRGAEIILQAKNRARFFSARGATSLSNSTVRSIPSLSPLSSPLANSATRITLTPSARATSSESSSQIAARGSLLSGIVFNSASASEAISNPFRRAAAR